MTFLQWCREANIWLGLCATIAVGYLAVIGFYRNQIAFRWLFVLFAVGMFLAGAGSKQGQVLNAPTGPVTAGWTAELTLVVIVSIYYARRTPRGPRK